MGIVFALEAANEPEENEEAVTNLGSSNTVVMLVNGRGTPKSSPLYPVCLLLSTIPEFLPKATQSTIVQLLFAENEKRSRDSIGTEDDCAPSRRIKCPLGTVTLTCHPAAGTALRHRTVATSTCHRTATTLPPPYCTTLTKLLTLTDRENAFKS